MQTPWYCPECGYRNAGFNCYCASCGWDGDELEEDEREPYEPGLEKADRDWGER